MKVKISIIIPVYNTQKYLEKCIDSVLNQTFQEFELILIDDGSKDNSAKIMERYLKKFPNKIKCIFQKNQGQSAARNHGLDIATGKYIVFVDSDDYIGENYIEKLYYKAEKCHSDMVLCNYTKIDENGRVLKKCQANFEEKGVRIPSYISCNRIIKRELFEKYNIRYKEGVVCEDIPVMLMLEAVAKDICIISLDEYYYRTNPKSTTATLKKRRLRMDQLPFEAMEESILFCQRYKKQMDEKQLEYFVCRIWTSLLFEVGRGAPRQVRKEMCNQVVCFMKKYYPNYNKNPYVKLGKFGKMSRMQRLGVWLCVHAMRIHMLYFLSTVCAWL